MEASRRKNTSDCQKSRTIENLKTSMVMKLNLAELCVGGIVTHLFVVNQTAENMESVVVKESDDF